MQILKIDIFWVPTPCIFHLGVLFSDTVNC